MLNANWGDSVVWELLTLRAQDEIRDDKERTIIRKAGKMASRARHCSGQGVGDEPTEELTQKVPPGRGPL